MGNRGNEEWETKRRREITIETDRVLVVRSRIGSFTAWCDECGTTARMVTPDAAAVIVGLSLRVIYRWVEAGTIHWMEPSPGSLLVCSSSLVTSMTEGHEEPLEQTVLDNHFQKLK